MKEIIITPNDTPVKFEDLCARDRADALSSCGELRRLIMTGKAIPDVVDDGKRLTVDGEYACDIAERMIYRRAGDKWAELVDGDQSYGELSHFARLVSDLVIDAKQL